MPTQILNNFLLQKGIDKDLQIVLSAIARAGKYVCHAIETGDLGLAGTSNLFGEDQLALDVLADKIFTEHLKATDLVNKIASEEKQQAETFSEKNKFCIAFDPLDGSSLVDTNLAIGAIFAIWEGNDFIGKKGKDMKAACYLVFGPRTTLTIATKQKVWEFALNQLGEFSLQRDDIYVIEKTKTFSPGNLRAIKEREDYKNLVNAWQNQQLTLRYSGGMVPDIHSILAKGNGIFSYPSFSKYPYGKLRLLFECAPFAFIMEKAGGLAKDEQGNNILDLEIKEIHQRTTIFIGSKEEVNRCEKYLKR